MEEYNSINRHHTRKVMVGNVAIGGDSPITVQSMTNTKTYDVDSTVSQILSLEEAGCEIIRVAVTDMESARAISKIKKQIHIPIVADVQFDYRLAIEAVKNGADKLRINPGNIGDKNRVKKVVETAKALGAPIRIGVNSGSLERDLLEKYKRPTPEAMVESALRHVEILENLNFEDIVISIKSSNVLSSIRAYELMAQKSEYPLHLGITEAGTTFSGTVKSSIGLGTLLHKGIGDTIRVSLTGDTVDEVRVGIEILKSLDLKKQGLNLISCPTCGRTQINLINIAREVEEKLKYIKEPLTVAVMGCAVNGPGEAKEADIGIAGGKNNVVLFKKGKIVKAIPEKDAVSELIQEVIKMTEDRLTK